MTAVLESVQFIWVPEGTTDSKTHKKYDNIRLCLVCWYLLWYVWYVKWIVRFHELKLAVRTRDINEWFTVEIKTSHTLNKKTKHCFSQRLTLNQTKRFLF